MMNNNAIFKDFTPVNNISYNIPVVQSEKTDRQNPVKSTAIAVGSTGMGALGGLALYKSKEKSLLSDLKNDTLEFKKTLTDAFEDQEVIKLTKKTINVVQNNIDNNLLIQEQTLEKNAAELASHKSLTDETMANLKGLHVKFTEQLNGLKAKYSDYENKAVLEPLNEFIDGQMSKIKNAKKINIVAGAGIGLALGVSILLINYFNNKNSTSA